MLEKIKELRSTKRGNAAFKLSLYFVFLVGVILFLLAANNTQNNRNTSLNSNSENTNKSETSVKTYFDKQQLLVKGKYSFNYEITGQTKTYFYGDYDDGVVSGLKDSDDDFIKYSIDKDGKVYKNKLNNKEEIDDLYKGLDESLFDFEKLFIKLNNVGPETSREEDYKVYTYKNIDDYEYKVTTDDNCILKINIKNAIIEYEFTFEF